MRGARADGAGGDCGAMHSPAAAGAAGQPAAAARESQVYPELPVRLKPSPLPVPFRVPFRPSPLPVPCESPSGRVPCRVPCRVPFRPCRATPRPSLRATRAGGRAERHRCRSRMVGEGAYFFTHLYPPSHFAPRRAALTPPRAVAHAACAHRPPVRIAAGAGPVQTNKQTNAPTAQRSPIPRFFRAY